MIIVRFAPGENFYLSYYGRRCPAGRGDAPRDRVEAFLIKEGWKFFWRSE